MYTQNICEALYALPSQRVQPRRKPYIKPAATALLGIVLLVINSLCVSDSAGAISMTLLVLGITLILYGGIVVIYRLSNSESVPYDTKSSCFLKYRERYFDRMLLDALQRAVERNDIKAIDDMPTTNVSAITLLEYRTKDGSLQAYSIYEYAEFEHRPIGKVHIFER